MKRILVVLLGLMVWGIGRCVAEEPSMPGEQPRTGRRAENRGFQNPGAGIYGHQILSAVSPDSAHWTLEGKVLFDHASVPDAVITQDKTIFLYFVDASEGHFLGGAKSKDLGKTWERFRVTIDGKERTDAVDPCPVLLEDGKIRLYYFGNFGLPGRMMDVEHKFYSAISEDGVHFKEEGICLSAPQITDPDVVKTEDGWKMFVSKGRELLSATSTDGKNFTLDGITVSRAGAISDTIAVDGGYRTYISSRGIMSQFTKDFSSWKEEGTCISQNAADPSVIQLPDGTYKMFYKQVTQAKENLQMETPEMSSSKVSLTLKNSWSLPQRTHYPELVVLDDDELLVVVTDPQGRPGTPGQIKHRAYRYDFRSGRPIGDPFIVTRTTPEYGEPTDHRVLRIGDELVVIYQTIILKEGFIPRGEGPMEPHMKEQSLMLAKFTLDGREILRKPIIAHAIGASEDNFSDLCILWYKGHLLISTGTAGWRIKFREVDLDGNILKTHVVQNSPNTIPHNIGNSFLEGEPLGIFSAGYINGSLTFTSLDADFQPVQVKRFPVPDREDTYPTGCMRADDLIFVTYASRKKRQGDPVAMEQNPYDAYLKVLDSEFKVVTDIQVGSKGFARIHSTIVKAGDSVFVAWSKKIPGRERGMPQVMIHEYQIKKEL